MQFLFKIIVACVAIVVVTSGCVRPLATENKALSAMLESGYAELPSSPAWAVKPDKAPSAMPAKPPVRTSDPSREKVRYLGSAPYICTPSGFGRTSTCFSRS